MTPEKKKANRHVYQNAAGKYYSTEGWADSATPHLSSAAIFPNFTITPPRGCEWKKVGVHWSGSFAYPI